MKKMIAIMVTLVVVVAIFGASWGICCGLLKLISMCFGFNFSVKIATGVWLVMIFVNFCIRKKKVE